MEPSRKVERLLEIMIALRTPNTGCPWDLEQDFKSIYPYTIEEAYEVADAIERDDMEDLRLELGDLLLQSVYHAQIASEAGLFDFGDVVEGITAKMIRRHPHVFSAEDVTAEEFSASGMENMTWERIKAEEKAEAAERRQQLGLPPKQEDMSILAGVPRNLPALVEALKLQRKAAKTGFDWNNAHAVMAKVGEELEEFQVALDSGKKDAFEEEFGDLIFALINVARHHGIDPETALKNCNRKFRRRFGHVENKLRENGTTTDEATLEEMEALWQDAKQFENKS